MRSKKEGEFSQTEIQIMELIQKHIEIGLDNMIRICERKLRSKLHNRAFEQMEIGMGIVNQHYEIIESNDYFNRIMRMFGVNVNFRVFFTNKILSKVSSALQENRHIVTVEVDDIIFRILVSEVNTLQGIVFQYKLIAFHNDNKHKEEIYAGKLSNRENEIIQCIAKGYKNNQIAEELYLSVNTVKAHIQNMYKKMNVNNRVALLNCVSSIQKEDDIGPYSRLESL